MLNASPRNKDENKFYLRGKSFEAHLKRLNEIKNRHTQFKINDTNKYKTCKSPNNIYTNLENFKLNKENAGLKQRLKEINLRNSKFTTDKNYNDVYNRRIKSYEILRQIEKHKLLSLNDDYKTRISQTSGIVHNQMVKRNNRKVKLQHLELKDDSAKEEKKDEPVKEENKQEENKQEENNDERK